ncbi:MAG TPA: FAD-dependent oxidoreductase [Solirubrobacteraceae bacterium]|nr:FAD-dependent oxidoreductase [Solirubrobacteraceae bacterium]
MTASRYDLLFDPVQIGPVTAPNRFYGLPYSLGHGIDADPLRAAAHHATRAEGGWGVITAGECTFSVESDHLLSVATDERAQALRPITEAVHAHGALASLELAHSGVVASPLEVRTPALAPSQLQFEGSFFGRTIPKAMERDEIHRVQREWAAAAVRGRDAGFDLICVYGAHSSLLMQFLSPFYNHREDEYGGSLENRARMWLETLALVREAVGDTCGIVARVAVDALGPGGVDLEEGLAFIRMADPLVDLWDITIGGLDNSRVDLTPSRVYEEGFALTWSGRVHEATDKPIALNGRFTTPDLMADLVRKGTATLVGGARPGIADPFLPQKIRAGRFDDVVECIGCNQCAQRHMVGSLSCSQNPTAGEERRRGWHPERFERAENPDLPILIVGAGPAGMEAATVLGRRGFQMVHLVDARPRMGGHLEWFASLPGFRPWARLTELREHRIGRLSGVQFAPRTELDAAGVRDYGAEVVILATGARWAPSGLSLSTHAPIPGADAEQVLTPEQLLLDGRRPAGKRVVVVDGEGELVGAATAQWLQREGYDVEIVTPWPTVAIHAEHAGEAPTLRRELVQGGAELVTGMVVTAIEADAVVCADEFGRERRIAADAVVLATQRRSRDALYHELVGDRAALDAAGIVAVHRAGDCVAPRMLAESTFEGHRIGRLLGPDGALATDPALVLA